VYTAQKLLRVFLKQESCAIAKMTRDAR